MVPRNALEMFFRRDFCGKRPDQCPAEAPEFTADENQAEVPFHQRRSRHERVRHDRQVMETLQHLGKFKNGTASVEENRIRFLDERDGFFCNVSLFRRIP